MLQLINGEEHPMTNLNRELTSWECKYAIVEIECLAFKWAPKSLKYNVLGW